MNDTIKFPKRIILLPCKFFSNLTSVRHHTHRSENALVNIRHNVLSQVLRLCVLLHDLPRRLAGCGCRKLLRHFTLPGRGSFLYPHRPGGLHATEEEKSEQKASAFLPSPGLGRLIIRNVDAQHGKLRTRKAQKYNNWWNYIRSQRSTAIVVVT